MNKVVDYTKPIRSNFGGELEVVSLNPRVHSSSPSDEEVGNAMIKLICKRGDEFFIFNKFGNSYYEGQTNRTLENVPTVYQGEYMLGDYKVRTGMYDKYKDAEAACLRHRSKPDFIIIEWPVL